jgi:hypothetical protein
MRRLVASLLVALCLAGTAHAQVIDQIQISAQDAGSCATANACATFAIGNAASVSFGITGTWSGTLTFQTSADGSTWVTTQVTNLASGTTPVTTTTGNGTFGLSNSGFLSVRVVFTTRASGTAVVTVTRGWSARGGGATSSGASTVTGGTCTNQAVTAISTTGVPTCTTLTSAYKDTSIASTGVDINTSYQVTATHLAAALPFAQGGTAATSQPALTTAQPADQTGNATATFKMNGLGAAAAPCTITPVATGRVVFTITGNLNQTVNTDAINYKMAYGTGTAPANAAAATGTLITAAQGAFVPAGGIGSFSVTGRATGLTLTTAVWYDLQINESIGGTASVTNITCTAFEI